MGRSELPWRGAAWTVIGKPFALHCGTTIFSRTVSIQKTAVILKAWAFAFWGGVLLSPVRNAISAGPPAKPGGVVTGGAGGLVGLGGGVGSFPAASVVTIRVTKLCIFCDAISFCRTTLGLSIMSCVMVPALMNEVRSCGIRAVP